MSLQVDFILFTHYSANEASDAKRYGLHRSAGLPASSFSFEGTDQLRPFLASIRDLLAGDSHRKGVLVVFYATGWRETLLQIQRGGFLEREAVLALECGDAFKEQVLAEIEKAGLPDLTERLRIITARLLFQFFSSTQWDLAQHLGPWLVGESFRMTYDSPKLVDAVIRLRAMDSGVPVLRIDQDVLFNQASVTEPALGLADAIARTCTVHHELRADLRVNYAMLSGSYKASSVLGRPAASSEDWASAFATRIIPALVASDSTFDRDLAHGFLGLDEAGNLTEKGLWNVGSHPLRAVISGALLSLSPGAILDLPPFSNFSQKVMWIDDHLKFLFHWTLRHFERLPEDPWQGERPEVRKGRGESSNLRTFILADYLPTLLWGTIVDTWIQNNPHVKLSMAELARFDGRNSTRLLGHPGPLSRELHFALRTGQLDRRSRGDLYRQLREAAIRRIRTVSELWEQLTTDDGRESFAAQWVRGTVPQSGLNRPEDGLLQHGLSFEGNEKDFERLNPAIREKLDLLMVEAMSYIDWTLAWPKVVQTIRSLPPGRFEGDPDFRPQE